MLFADLPETFPLRLIPLLCVAAAMLLIYIPFGVVGWARFQLGYDYSAPRTMFEKLPPYAQRATWAHQNGFETFAPFAAASLIAYVTGPHLQIVTEALTGDALIAGLGIGFLIARLLYSLCYILNLPIGRSACYVVSISCTAGILWFSLVYLISTPPVAVVSVFGCLRV